LLIDVRWNCGFSVGLIAERAIPAESLDRRAVFVFFGAADGDGVC
jgi:hypothetical protein